VERGDGRAEGGGKGREKEGRGRKAGGGKGMKILATALASA